MTECTVHCWEWRVGKKCAAREGIGLWSGMLVVCECVEERAVVNNERNVGYNLCTCNAGLTKRLGHNA